MNNTPRLSQGDLSRAYTYAWRQLVKQAREIYPAVCHLCHTDIDTALPRTDARSYTVDHLDPVETHGTDVPTLDRVRPAHRSCNGKRGSKPLASSPRSVEW